MQFTSTIVAIVGLFASAAFAAPATEIEARANAKLNQYSNPNCLDNNGGNVPTFHASPSLRKCYNIDPTTVSFFFGLGPLSQTWVYPGQDCSGGLSVNLGNKGGCQAVDANFSNGFETIGSIMMD
ncbi:hypothetical protein G7Y89_g9219 [Cudoniella acicularis]|uniref:Uncharacterized protein n=1 Tax=Cudoniella acicularis TaxID=354080 RepID=A0A8H4W091_9HELO|nr:hypothetical protein G7Y89_g9219 [Cudoniella acicularis]